MSDIFLRPYQPADLDPIKALTLECFDGVTIEQNLEATLGTFNGRDWRWRKARQIDEDVAANPSGIFVAETEGRLIGYITTRLDAEAGKGRIPNLAVASEFRGHGLGRRLIEHALEYFRAQGLGYAVIETLDQNPVGLRAYPACGFVEIACQVHFARRL